MKLTARQAEMVMTAYFDGIADQKHSLCCAPDALVACAVIIGRSHAEALQAWTYETLGCGGGGGPSSGPDDDEKLFLYWLDKITALVSP